MRRNAHHVARLNLAQYGNVMSLAATERMCREIVAELEREHGPRRVAALPAPAEYQVDEAFIAGNFREPVEEHGLCAPVRGLPAWERTASDARWRNWLALVERDRMRRKKSRVRRESRAR